MSPLLQLIRARRNTPQIEKLAIGCSCGNLLKYKGFGRFMNVRFKSYPSLASAIIWVTFSPCRNSCHELRHAFHAGNFADVIRHIVLVRILTYLQEKPAAFRVIDTHAGAGVYDLTGEEASRGGEWLTGIARVMQARFSEATLPLVMP